MLPSVAVDICTRIVGIDGADVLQGLEQRQSTSTRENADHEDEDARSYDGRTTRYRDDEHEHEHEHEHGARDEPGSPRSACGDVQNGNRRRSRQEVNGLAEVNGEQDRSRSVEYVHGLAKAEGGWGEGRRRRAPSHNNGHDRPTPSYALPTKHFKTPDR